MKIFLKSLAVAIGILVLALVFFYFRYKPKGDVQWGLTYSYQEAQGLGFDWKTLYLDMLADLKPKKLRLMAYWEDIERDKGKFDFTIVDQELQEAQKEGINVLLVVGRKQPRWPECHQPAWFNNLSQPEQDQAVLDMLKVAVKHFQSFSAIKDWQVENEPFFNFGPECPVSSKEFFTQEVSLVKQLDSRPVVATDSGERGSWIPAAKSGADILGATFYRVSFDAKYGGYYKYPIPSWFYRIKAGILATFTRVDEVWDVELQMEPWFTNGALNAPLEQQKALMNPKVFGDNVQYAKNSGIRENYLWGVEWWYWMAQKNNDWGVWTAAKTLLNTK